jgi:hypothetical protein
MLAHKPAVNEIAKHLNFESEVRAFVDELDQVGF